MKKWKLSKKYYDRSVFNAKIRLEKFVKKTLWQLILFICEQCFSWQWFFAVTVVVSTLVLCNGLRNSKNIHYLFKEKSFFFKCKECTCCHNSLFKIVAKVITKLFCKIVVRAREKSAWECYAVIFPGKCNGKCDYPC